ncbi:MAG: hypothetical protein QG597_4279 [Actinomycetota bacterium]|nr:hypothetical protein [Actinomycetota bacterium]
MRGAQPVEYVQAPLVCGVPVADQGSIPSRFLEFLPDGEHLRAVGRICLDGWRWKEGYAALTDKRLIIVHDDSFIDTGSIEQEHQLEDVTGLYILAKHGAMGGPDLRMFASGEVVLLHFAEGCSIRFVKAFRRFLRDAGPKSGRDESRVIRADGERLLTEIAHPYSPGPAVIFSNGWGGDLTEWRPVTRLLGDLTCLTFDRPGFGGSLPSKLSKVTLAAECRRVISVADAFAPGRPLVAVGWSYGAVIAEATARLYPDRVAGLALVEAHSIAADAQDKWPDRLLVTARSPWISQAKIDEDARIPKHCRQARKLVQSTSLDRLPIVVLSARANEKPPARLRTNPRARYFFRRSSHDMLRDVPDAVAEAVRVVAAQSS